VNSAAGAVVHLIRVTPRVRAPVALAEPSYFLHRGEVRAEVETGRLAAMDFSSADCHQGPDIDSTGNAPLAGMYPGSITRGQEVSEGLAQAASETNRQGGRVPTEVGSGSERGSRR
jgi:hypothetical protein